MTIKKSHNGKLLTHSHRWNKTTTLCFIINTTAYDYLMRDVLKCCFAVYRSVRTVDLSSPKVSSAGSFTTQVMYTMMKINWVERKDPRVLLPDEPRKNQCHCNAAGRHAPRAFRFWRISVYLSNQVIICKSRMISNQTQAGRFSRL